MYNETQRWHYPRFFSDNIDIESNTIITSEEDAKHIIGVLRMKIGDKAILCDKNKTDYLCELRDGSKNVAKFSILDKKQNAAEPDIEVTLYQAMPKNDKLDLIVQKSTELGVTRIVPFLSKRCVSRPDTKSSEKKLQRLNKITYEAAKQCGRGIIPEVMPLTDFKTAINSVGEDTTAIIFYECGGEKLKNIALNKKKFAIFIGSEGGFEKEEIKYALSKGVISAYLGERILRCETAPIAALAVLMNLTENL